MKISIITISYNSGSTIGDTIQSVLDQSFPNVEYIIIDGKSTDNTMDIVRSFGDRIHHVISEPDTGLYNAMNKGINLATGDVTGILNSDDFYAHKNVLKKIAEKFSSSDVDAVYADLQYVKQDDTNKIHRYWKSGEYNRDNFLKGWMPPHPTFFLRTKYYHQFGNFREDMKISADYELMLRMLYRHRLNVSYLPEVIVKMRTGGQSNANLAQRLRSRREDKYAWEVNQLKPGLLTLILKPLLKIKQFFIQ